MNVIVCIKQVPDTTEVRLDPVTGTLIREGVPSIINPDDKAGLEAALRLKDNCGAHITALSMGPKQAEAALTEALAMGVDEAVLLSDRRFGGADTWATSSTLAAAISQMDYDLIITGRQAIDGDTAQVGPQIAEHLGIPSISYVEDMQAEDSHVIVKRQFEDRYHIIKAKMPCLITTLSEFASPRYMTPGGIRSAFREKEIKHLDRDDIPVKEENIGLKGSPTRVAKTFTKSPKGKGSVVKDDPAQAVEWLVERLQEKYLI